jgi:polygalacturonase
MDFDVYDYGATGDGVTLDTKEIQSAIDECSEFGGGRVVLTRGDFLTGTLFMRSNVELHIEVSATLYGSDNIDDYSVHTHKQLYRKETHMDRCLIYCHNVENIAFTGRGTIHGQGEKFVLSAERPKPVSRPMLIRYLDCRNIRLAGLRLLNPASWTNAFIRCSNIWVDGIETVSRANRNGDGLDFDACQNVFVSNCNLDCSDDCICLQNSEAELICKNIVITNTIMCSKWAGIRIGLLSCGAIENVTVTNCIFRDIDCSALKIQSAEGNVLQNMVFSNLVMENVQRPLFITLNHYRERVDLSEEVTGTSRLRHMLFDNIRATGKPADPKYLRSCIIIDSLPEHAIEDISLSNIRYTAVGGGTEEHAVLTDIPYLYNTRAECYKYNDKDGPLPAYGLFARNVKGLAMNGVHIDTMQHDARPPYVLIGCEIKEEPC